MPHEQSLSNRLRRGDKYPLNKQQIGTWTTTGSKSDDIPPRSFTWRCPHCCKNQICYIYVCWKYFLTLSIIEDYFHQRSLLFMCYWSLLVSFYKDICKTVTLSNYSFFLVSSVFCHEFWTVFLHVIILICNDHFFTFTSCKVRLNWQPQIR